MTLLPALRTFLLSSLLAFPLAGCGVSAYQPGRTAGFDLDGTREINDEDVRKAFEARPQLASPMRVAFYTFDVSKSDEIEASLRGVPGVADVYRIPPLLVTGQRRHDGEGGHGARPPQELSLKKLRLIAARAHADVVIVFDYGHRVDTSANGWTALTPLLLPIFFVPFLDRKVDSYMDTYVVDTRNGFLYAHITAEEESRVDSTTIYHDTDPTIRAQWGKVLAATRQKVEGIARSAAPLAPSAPPAPAAKPLQACAGGLGATRIRSPSCPSRTATTPAAPAPRPTAASSRVRSSSPGPRANTSVVAPSPSSTWPWTSRWISRGGGSTGAP
jgi:hypothetical protein